MDFALSTRWNTRSHSSGEAMVQEIIDAGFKKVELGFDLTLDLVPGVQRMVSSNSIEVTSLHNFCPVPIGAPRGHPELFALASDDPTIRNSAVKHTANTVEFAARVGGKFVVVHAGNVEMSNLTHKLIDLAEQGKQFDNAYEKIKLKLYDKREKKAPRYINALYKSIEDLMPILEKNQIGIAIENLPSWEAIPSEMEMEALFSHFNSPLVRYWHDMGHGQIRQNLGFIGHLRWLEKLSPYLAGMHVHDALPPANDHLMPPNGKIDFQSFKNIATSGIVLVIEPAPLTPLDQILTGVQTLKTIWGGNE